MATTRSLLGLDGKHRGLHAISETASHVLQHIPDEERMQSHALQVNAHVVRDEQYFSHLRTCICEYVKFVFLLGLQRAWRGPHIWQAGRPPALVMGSSCGSGQLLSRGGANWSGTSW